MISVIQDHFYGKGFSGMTYQLHTFLKLKSESQHHNTDQVPGITHQNKIILYRSHLIKTQMWTFLGGPSILSLCTRMWKNQQMRLLMELYSVCSNQQLHLCSWYLGESNK